MAAELDAYEERTGNHIPIHVDGASGAFAAPFAYPGYKWDFKIPRVVVSLELPSGSVAGMTQRARVEAGKARLELMHSPSMPVDTSMALHLLAWDGSFGGRLITCQRI